jgi:site-specific DNA recombinase
LIAYRLTNWLRRISCWYPTGDGRLQEHPLNHSILIRRLMMNKPAAIYARVSSNRQKENHTIASQTAALIEHAEANGYTVPAEWVFQDEGYSGANLVRPGLEALRDLAAEGEIRAALVYSPDRLSRKYAYQVLLAEELSRCGVELVFLKAPAGTSPEDQLLVQFRG